jgi:uncharacterized damage-inducible protein DinB
VNPLRANFLLLARYGAWATRRLLDHVDRLHDAEYRGEAGLFFHSVHGTLNHLLVAEHALWFRRFAEGVSPALRLDEELEHDRVALRERLLAASLQWAPLIAQWPDARFDGELAYRSTQGVDHRLPFSATLTHVFNHGTHHRGQVTAALTRLGQPSPELDLVRMLLEPEGAPR